MESKTLPPPRKNFTGEGKSVKAKKRFSIKNKLIVIFGALIFVALFISGFISLRFARKAVTKRAEIQLVKEAELVTQLIDSRINSYFQFLTGISRIPVFHDKTVSYQEKLSVLQKEVERNENLHEAAIVDTDGFLLTVTGEKISVNEYEWFQKAVKGKQVITEPFISVTDSKLIITFAVPIYGEEKNIIGVLGAVVLAEKLGNQIDDIKVGNTGYSYIIGLTGTTIAHKNFDLVKNKDNVINNAKTDKSYESLAKFVKHALEVEESEVKHYEYKGLENIGSYATMKTTGWTIIIKAPVHEFLGTVLQLRKALIGVGFGLWGIILVIVFFVALKIVRPINVAVTALKDIAQGEGDLTVRLPIAGNDEITDLSEYFNETIAKIGSSIKIVGDDTNTMASIGSELASNMTETASAVQQISANIDGVKKQTFTQATSVTETAATIEEIIRTISQLNNSIESQAASVGESSAAVEEMVANIASITQTLAKTDDVVKELTAATTDGKDTILTSNTVTQKVAEESGALMEASSVIQHIASQTNLLAMNAAIEAAHAGEAGKGFAVVADEIRKLAEESSTQGKNITTTLKTLSGEITMLSDSAKIAEEKFNAIFALSEQVREMSTKLMEAMHEQESGSKEVLEAIRDINMVTAQVNDGSAEMLKGSEGVAVEMKKLDDLTRAITDSMNEMASGAVQISNAVQEVNEITQKNKESIDSLVEEVNKFKV